MARQVKNFKIELNSNENLRDLLQQIIELADEQIIQTQNEIEKLKNSTDLTQEVMDGKAKYAKAVNDFMAMKDKAVSKKIEVAKMLGDVIAHGGDAKQAIEDTQNAKFDLRNLRSYIDEIQEQQANPASKTITLKKQ